MYRKDIKNNKPILSRCKSSEGEFLRIEIHIQEQILTLVHSDDKNGRIARTNTENELFICDIKILKAIISQSFRLRDEIFILSSRLSWPHNMIRI